MTRLIDRLTEFKHYVWNHSEDAFQAKFDKCAALTDKELLFLSSLLSPDNLQHEDTLSARVADAVSIDSSRVLLLLQVTGLTRNKIIQDIKAFARANKRSVSTSSPHALFNSREGSTLASKYLARQLIRVFGHLTGCPTKSHLEAVNQATWPGYIRQERAKRMGHEAEYRLACLLQDCGLPFEPVEKADNPLCRDALIDGVSYDIVSPTVENPLLRVKATVHTANIGQYGESKDDLEIREAVASIKKSSKSGDVTLLAFVDGVGFESNRAGLEGVLSNADEFCQFRTIWKAAVIAAHKSGKKVQLALPKTQHADFARFVDRWPVKLRDKAALGDSPAGWTDAGDAFVKCR